ncbi:MAG: hypothetical protein WKF45_10400 [Ilumatobacteraceae bacterium]
MSNVPPSRRSPLPRPRRRADSPRHPQPPHYPAASSPPPGAPVARPNVGLAMLTAVVAAASGLAVLVASEQALVDRGADERHFYVQVAVFVVAGLGWALAHPGPLRALRAGLGAVAGAIAGVAGTFALGSTDQHVEALGDEVFSGASAGRALLWAAVTAAAWGVTVVAGTPRADGAPGHRRRQSATGAAMGLLAGTTQSAGHLHHRPVVQPARRRRASVRPSCSSPASCRSCWLRSAGAQRRSPRSLTPVSPPHLLPALGGRRLPDRPRRGPTRRRAGHIARGARAR